MKIRISKCCKPEKVPDPSSWHAICAGITILEMDDRPYAYATDGHYLVGIPVEVERENDEPIPYGLSIPPEAYAAARKGIGRNPTLEFDVKAQDQESATVTVHGVTYPTKIIPETERHDMGKLIPEIREEGGRVLALNPKLLYEQAKAAGSSDAARLCLVYDENGNVESPIRVEFPHNNTTLGAFCPLIVSDA